MLTEYQKKLKELMYNASLTKDYNHNAIIIVKK